MILGTPDTIPGERGHNSHGGAGNYFVRTLLNDVPQQAISMSIKQIMKSQAIICTVPDRRKARAVHNCFTGKVTPMHPASVLRQHKNAYLYLDAAAASSLKQEDLIAFEN